MEGDNNRLEVELVMENLVCEVEKKLDMDRIVN